MRTATVAILGTPFACWALYVCLTMVGVPSTPAIFLSFAWGALWLAMAHFGRNSRLLRRRRSLRGRGTPGGRGVWAGAVLGTYFLPIPVCLLTLLVDQLSIASGALILPLFAMLAAPAPTALWWMLLWPAHDENEEIMRPLGWRRYTPHVSLAAIPPRGAGAIRTEIGNESR